MSVFDELMDAESRDTIAHVVETISESLPVEPRDDDFWVFYGSIVVNNLQPSSDIDVLYVAREPLKRAFRHQAYCEGRPVTVYIVSEEHLSSDGEEYAYGGYFSGKLFSPHVVVDRYGKLTVHHDKYLQSVVGDFLANFVDLEKSRTYSINDVATASLFAYLQLCPWYEVYLTKFYWQQESDFKVRLTQILRKHYTQSLLSVGLIQKVNDKYVVRQQKSSYGTRKSSYRRRIRAIARFWSYGAIEHENDCRFSDYYFDKAEDTLDKIDPSRSELGWIYEELNLPSIDGTHNGEQL